MNKTVTVNIGGIVFHIDENAYEKFKLYLESIRSHFTTADGRDEIMQDIEARIAEMFQERVKDSKQVITLADVDDVTRLMGKPEEFEGTEEKHQQQAQPETDDTAPVKRRLFRNPDEKMLGGVCSGIANYFDVDIVWIRLAFVLLFLAYSSGFWIYVVLWIIIPEAKTAADKLQMKGEPVTVSNIQKNVREEMEALKKRMDEMSSGGAKKAGTAIGRLFEAIGSIFLFIIRLIGKIIAFAFMLAALLILFVLFVSFFAVIKVPGTHYPEVLNHIFLNGSQFFWSYIGVVLLIGVPVLMIAYAGAKMIFNIKSRSRVIGLTALGLWIVGLIICSLIGVKIAREFSEKESVRKDNELIQPASKKLFIESNRRNTTEKDYDHGWKIDWDEENGMSFQDSQFVSNEVNLDIVKSPNDSFQLTQIFYARGVSGKDAADNASRINYSFSQTDSLLRLNRYYSLGREDKYRGQYVQLVLKVPVGGSVYFGKSLRHVIFDIKNLQNVLDNDMLNRTWKMTEKGLSCVDCTGDERKVGRDYEEDFSDAGDIQIHDKEGNIVKIGKHGVHIDGSSKEEAIDSEGITVIKDGKEVVKINKAGVTVNDPDKEKKK